MNISIRRALVALTAAVTMVSLSACSSPTPPDGIVRDREGTVKTVAATPETFVTKAQWGAERLENAPVIITDFGLLTFVSDTTAGTYSAGLFDASTGKLTWTSRAVSSEDAMPALGWTKQDGRHWITVTVTSGKTASIYTYDPMLSGQRITATTSVAFTGKSKAPKVIVGNGGVLVLGAKEGAALQYRPQVRKTTVLSKGPSRQGDQGTPLLVHDNGFLLTFPKGGFAYASDSGGWDSARTAPDNVDRAKGEVLAVSNGTLLIEWPSRSGGDGNKTLMLHSLQSGRAIMEYDADDPLIAQQRKENLPLVPSTDERTLAWGEIVFDMDKKKGRVVYLNGGQPASIHNDILYAAEADRPLGTSPSSTSATPETSAPSSTTSATSSSTKFHGFVALDLSSGSPLGGEIGMVPMGFSLFGQGIFAPEGTALYSVALR